MPPDPGPGTGASRAPRVSRREALRGRVESVCIATLRVSGSDSSSPERKTTGSWCGAVTRLPGPPRLRWSLCRAVWQGPVAGAARSDPSSTQNHRKCTQRYVPSPCGGPVKQGAERTHLQRRAHGRHECFEWGSCAVGSATWKHDAAWAGPASTEPPSAQPQR